MSQHPPVVDSSITLEQLERYVTRIEDATFVLLRELRRQQEARHAESFDPIQPFK